MCQHPARQPLSEKELDCIDKSIGKGVPLAEGKRLFARAIEAAHKIVPNSHPPADANPPA